MGPNGWYTITATNGQSGLTTTTVTVTTTEVEAGVTTTQVITSVHTGTFVAAAVNGGSSTTSSSHNAAPTLGSKHSVEALVIVGMVVMVAL